MIRFVVVATAISFFQAACAQPEPTPMIGDPAPPLSGEVRWLRGDPSPAFEKGTVYVLDLWAPWCAACVGYMSHLSEVATAYAGRDVTVIGIAVDHNPASFTPEQFLEVRGERMAYPVAEEIERGRVKSRFLPPDYAGLPFLFIVDRQGRLAWLSDPAHPHRGFDRALKQIVEGTYDLASAASDYRRVIRNRKTAEPLLQRLERARREENEIEIQEVLAELLHLDSKQFGHQAVNEFIRLLGERRTEDAYEYGRHLVRGKKLGRPSDLVNLERAILEAPEGVRRDHALALESARRALELAGDHDPDFLWELGRAYRAFGAPDSAWMLMNRAQHAAGEQNWGSDYLRLLRAEMQRVESEMERGNR